MRQTKQYGKKRFLALGMLCFLGVSCFTGCARFVTVERAKSAAKELPPYNRAEVIRDLQKRMGRFATLTAKTNMVVVDQNILVPASVVGSWFKKEYRKEFLRLEVSGQLLLKRDHHANRDVRFSGQMLAPSASFMLLGRNADFWVLMPTLDPEERDRTNVRGTVYMGTAQRGALRPKGTFSYRPQDIGDLLLYDEVFSEDMICYMETWEKYYILNFIRQNWEEHIYSRIWVNRSTGYVAIHQLFDRSGEVIAEGRFSSYRAYPSSVGDFTIDLPTQVVLLWPRDGIVMEAMLSDVKVNEQIADRLFEPVIPRDYRSVRLSLPGEADKPED